MTVSHTLSDLSMCMICFQFSQYNCLGHHLNGNLCLGPFLQVNAELSRAVELMQFLIYSLNLFSYFQISVLDLPD